MNLLRHLAPLGVSLLLAVAAAPVIHAQEAAPPVPPPAPVPAPAAGEAAGAAPGFPRMEEVRPGVLRIGKLLLEKETRSVTFPGKLNMSDGALEYLIVGPLGSTHESLLVTEIAPADLHMAMLLLGAKGAGLKTPSPNQKPPGQITDEYLKTAPQLEGDKVTILVTWEKDGKETTAQAEDWLLNTETGKPGEREPWLYTGSMFVGDTFLAQNEQSFAALVTYPPALINNPRKGNNNDSAWEVNTKSVPAVDTPLKITIRLEPDAK